MNFTSWLLAAAMLAGIALQGADSGKVFRSEFAVDKKNLGPTGKNPYFILEPGYRWHFAEGSIKITMTILAETRMLDGVETRVVEDKEEKNGKPIEITRDYYAVDRTTGDVYYFGEEVDVYKNGKVTHGGSWLSGVDGAQFGMMMPGKVTASDRFLQERAPKQKAQDRSQVVSMSEAVVTPTGTFQNCVHMHDDSAIEKGRGDHKWYAPGVGLVKDGKAVLVKVEKP